MVFNKILIPIALGFLVLISIVAIYKPPEYPEYTGEVVKEEITTAIETTTTTETTTSITTTTMPETTTTIPGTTTTTSIIGIVIDTACVDLGCPTKTEFVGSKSSNKYHYCNCRWAKRIKEENLVCFESVEDAQEQGYEPCGTCEPPGSSEEATTTESVTTTLKKETSDPCMSLGCSEGTQFVGSKNSDKYHDCDCRWAKKIKSENIVCFSSVEEAKNKGYVACKTCKPPED